jgi:hypothetical protein
MSAREELRTAGPIDVAQFHFRVEGRFTKTTDPGGMPVVEVLAENSKVPSPIVYADELRATIDTGVRELLGDDFTVAWLETREGSLEIVFLLTSTLN